VQVRFEWNEEKNRSNLLKHGIGFAAATRVFEDPDYVMEQDREVDGEERWQTIGRVGDVVILLVVHTAVEDEDDVIFRIISARRATAHERRRYEAKAN
jgi:uncharacterized protein